MSQHSVYTEEIQSGEPDPGHSQDYSEQRLLPILCSVRLHSQGLGRSAFDSQTVLIVFL